jgi:SET domain-containing protein
MMEIPNLGCEIRTVPGAGRGVFATRPFRVGELICQDPVILLDVEDWRSSKDTIFDDYVFEWPDAGTPMAISLGVGSLFNTSFDPNTKFVPDPHRKIITFTAIKPIAIGDEMLIDYDWETEKMDRLREGKSKDLHVIG